MVKTEKPLGRLLPPDAAAGAMPAAGVASGRDARGSPLTARSLAWRSLVAGAPARGLRVGQLRLGKEEPGPPRAPPSPRPASRARRDPAPAPPQLTWGRAGLGLGRGLDSRVLPPGSTFCREQDKATSV